MNGDGNADILFQNTLGQIVVWYMNSGGFRSGSNWISQGSAGDWKVVGVADMNGDGNADILFQNTLGQIVVWYMNGSGSRIGSAWISQGSAGDWKVH